MKLRDRIRWRIAILINRLPGQCWADLCDWALRYRSRPWSPMTRMCRDGVRECGSCYCGKLRSPGGGDPS